MLDGTQTGGQHFPDLLARPYDNMSPKEREWVDAVGSILVVDMEMGYPDSPSRKGRKCCQHRDSSCLFLQTCFSCRVPTHNPTPSPKTMSSPRQTISSDWAGQGYKWQEIVTRVGQWWQRIFNIRFLKPDVIHLPLKPLLLPLDMFSYPIAAHPSFMPLISLHLSPQLTLTVQYPHQESIRKEPFQLDPASTSLFNIFTHSYIHSIVK